MQHVLIIGPQGSGKGTQAAAIAPRFNLVHLSTGDLFRALSQSDSELAREVRAYIERGDLVPDETTATVLFDALDEIAAREQPAGALLDGFPRNDAQADVLEAKIQERGDRLAAVIYLTVPREVLVERMLARGRSDDDPEILERRLEIYFQETEPLVERWRDQGIVLEIDGNQSIAAVTQSIQDGLITLLGQPVQGVA
jgi:adenylate kinase